MFLCGCFLFDFRGLDLVTFQDNVNNFSQEQKFKRICNIVHESLTFFKIVNWQTVKEQSTFFLIKRKKLEKNLET